MRVHFTKYVIMPTIITIYLNHYILITPNILAENLQLELTISSLAKSDIGLKLEQLGHANCR